MSETTDVVQQWHDAVNAGDVDRVLTLCTPDVAVGGPRGVAEGHAVMRAWLERSGIGLTPQEPLAESDGRVVVRELAHWRTTGPVPDGAPTEPVETWVELRVADGLVSSVRRFETAADVPPG